MRGVFQIKNFFYSNDIRKILLVIITCTFLISHPQAQSVIIGSVNDETARLLQLAGKFDSSISFTVRPLVSGKQFTTTGIYQRIDPSDTMKYGVLKPFAGKLGHFAMLPVTIQQQYNSHHPYGWNDGAMISAKGYQGMVSAGFYAAYGALEVQVMPEFVYAVNPPFGSNGTYGDNIGGRYQKIFPGQSTIKVSAGSFSLGVSSQNLWWGPGTHSSLVMSNNAPGFIHAFFSSRKPVKTFIGDFEWQLIGARLNADNSRPFEIFNFRPPSFPLVDDWRYLNAYVISYHPKWVPGLFLGMTRGLQRYNKDIKLSGTSVLNKYIPILTKPLQKANAQDDDGMRTDQLASFFLRWVLPKTKAEFYLEWGYNDYNQNFRDFLMSPTHSAAHIVGFKKIVDLQKNTYLDLGLEMTEMSQSTDQIIRNAGNWYEHYQVVQGYTNENQIMGAGAGMGCNVQTITATWIKEEKHLGVILERVERDPLNHTYKWTDLSVGIVPQWKYRNMRFSGIFQFINSSNYAWDKDINRFNFHSKVSIQYLF